MHGFENMRDNLNEYLHAMSRVALGLRRGNAAEVKDWLAISERLLRMHSRIDEIRIAEDKRKAWRAEQPHRLSVLEHRARFPR